MHELSIAESLLTTAIESIQDRAREAQEEIAERDVTEVHLRLGILAGVDKESLLFCYDVVTSETLLAGSRLVIEELPVVVFCESCRSEAVLPDFRALCCPQCGRPSLDIRQGQELELTSIHLSDRPTATTDERRPAPGTSHP